MIGHLIAPYAEQAKCARRKNTPRAPRPPTRGVGVSRTGRSVNVTGNRTRLAAVVTPAEGTAITGEDTSAPAVTCAPRLPSRGSAAWQG